MNDSSILSDSELSDNDNVVKNGVSMQHQDKPMPFDDIKPGMWVIVIYEEKFLAKVQKCSTSPLMCLPSLSMCSAWKSA